MAHGVADGVAHDVVGSHSEVRSVAHSVVRTAWFQKHARQQVRKPVDMIYRLAHLLSRVLLKSRSPNHAPKHVPNHAPNHSPKHAPNPLLTSQDVELPAPPVFSCNDAHESMLPYPEKINPVFAAQKPPLFFLLHDEPLGIPQWPHRFA